MFFDQMATEVAKLFNEADITWGFGGSCLLNCLGEAIQPRDLDIVVALKDIERAKELLLESGGVLLAEKQSDHVYLTEKFYTLNWRESEVDLMANAGISHKGEVFRLSFETKGPWGLVKRGGQTLWLSSPFDWVHYYRLMEGREHRVLQMQSLCERIKAESKATE